MLFEFRDFLKLPMYFMRFCLLAFSVLTLLSASQDVAIYAQAPEGNEEATINVGTRLGKEEKTTTQADAIESGITEAELKDDSGASSSIQVDSPLSGAASAVHDTPESISNTAPSSSAGSSIKAPIAHGASTDDSSKNSSEPVATQIPEQEAGLQVEKTKSLSLSKESLDSGALDTTELGSSNTFAKLKSQSRNKRSSSRRAILLQDMPDFQKEHYLGYQQMLGETPPSVAREEYSLNRSGEASSSETRVAEAKQRGFFSKILQFQSFSIKNIFISHNFWTLGILLLVFIFFGAYSWRRLSS